MTDAVSTPRPSIRKGYLLLLTAALLILGWYHWEPEQVLEEISDEELVKLRPLVEPHGEYAGSDSCRECHEDNHRSWHASWHRTMTQEGTLENIMGDFAVTNLTFPDYEGSFTLFERDGRAWIKNADLAKTLFGKKRSDRTEYPIVMTTGSHHFQAYWFPAGYDRTIALMPLVYLKGSDRWIPRAAINLGSSDGTIRTETGVWNDTCLRCHSTAPLQKRPESPSSRFAHQTQVAELGITCENCHGPGRNHVERHRNPDSPKFAQLKDHVLDPSRLDHRRSTQVCAQCHSISSIAADENGGIYLHPGEEFDDRCFVEQPGRRVSMSPEELAVSGPEVDSQFWPDGMVRVSGREYNGLLNSPCHTRGELSCVTCHQMHQPASDKRPVKEWANDQLKVAALGDSACLQCHSSDQYASRAHTHHASGSSGSSCNNCHMPHTTYGLLKVVRSHTINSPDVAATLEFGRPTACNLCHLDQTLAWTGEHLKEWYGIESPPIPEKHREIANGAMLALEGDAVQRAIVAWSMSWPPAVEASHGTNWIPAYLSRLLQDPYDAVRYIAGRSLKKFPSHRSWEYDFLAARKDLTNSAHQAHAIWENSLRPTGPNTHILIGTNGSLDSKRFETVYARRNDREVFMRE